MTPRKKQKHNSRNLRIESLIQRIMLDGAGFIEPLFYEPTPYLSEADTPEGFLPVPDCDQCVVGLETFEDGTLDFDLEIPEGEIIGPDFETGTTRLTDSVDGDDGVIDGTGQTGAGGSSFFSAGNTLTVNFPILVQSAGLVWTDGAVDVTDVVFEAFDQDGNSLGVVNAGDIADDSFMGTTAEDRFFGVSFGDGRTTGVTSIVITNVGGTGIEIDHVQFANCSECCDIDLELTKTVDATVVQVGDIVNWQVILTNNAENANTDATGVVVEDVIPAGLTLLSGVPTAGIFFNNTWTVFDPIAPGETHTLSLETQVQAGFEGNTIVNVAQVLTADQPDVDSTPGNDDGDQSEDDEDSAQISVAGPVDGIDLELTKTVDSSIVQVGDIVNWQVVVSNNPENANTDATGVIVEDVVPAGLTLLSGVPTAGIFFNNTWTVFDPISPGETHTLSLETQVQAGFEGTTIVNVAQVLTADQPDVDSTPGNDDGDQSEDDEDGAQITVAGPIDVIDLELTNTVDSSVVQVGEIVNWQVILTNNAENANTDATGVTVEDVIPAGLTLLSGVPTAGIFFNNTWTVFDPIAPGETHTLTLETQVQAGFEGSTIVNVAQVLTADQPDVDSTPGNDDGDQSEDDEDNAQISVAGPVDVIDLELTKTVDSSVVQVGDIVNWQVILTNNAETANTDATGVVVRDVLPAGLELLSAVPTGSGIYFLDEWLISEPVSPGESLTLDLQTRVLPGFAGDDIVNVAEVAAADQVDVDSTPNNDDGDQSEDDEANARITVVGASENLMLSGFSYIDTNNDGIFQGIELPLMGVEIQLMGTDGAGNEVNRATFTNIDGFYKFNDLLPGTYMVSQVQPIQFVDGQDTLGNLGGDDSVNDKFTVELSDNAELYNFGELGLRPEFVGKRLYLTSTPYDQWEFIDVREFSIWHSFNIDHASFLDINAALLDGEVLFTVLNENMEVVAERGAGVLASEADPIVLEGSGTYYLEISGEGEIESLSLEITAPQVTQDGGKVVAVATAGDDDVVLTLGSETHSLNISGLEYTFDATEVNEFHVGSYGGDDTITVYGTSLDDTGHVLESRGQFDSSAYSVDTYTFDNTTFVGGGGDDYVQIFGSNGDDRFAGILQDSTLTTPENVIHILGVDRVDAYGRGGYDYASVYGSHSDDLYYARDEYALMQGEGIMNYTKGFERVDAFGRGGSDVAQLFDSVGSDEFVSMPTFAYLIGINRTSYTKGFERVEAISTLGGNDRAIFLDDANTFESFISQLDYAYMTDGSYLHHASGFSKIRATSTGGNDTAQILDLKTGDTFEAQDDIAALSSVDRDDEVKGFPLVMVAAEAEENPTAIIAADIDYVLADIVNWL